MAYLLTPDLAEAIRHENLIYQEEVSRGRRQASLTFKDAISKKTLLTVSEIIKLAERKKPWDPDPATRYVFTLNVKLQHIGHDTHTAMVHFYTKPINMMDIKQRIEVKYKIPVCGQTLSFKKEVIHSEFTKLSETGIKNKDRIEVQYHSICDLEPMWICLKWFDHIQRFWEYFECSVWSGTPVELEYVLVAGLKENIPQHLISMFQPFMDDKSISNRDYFDDNGGVRYVHKALERLCPLPWRSLPVPFRILERECVNVLSYMTAHNTLKKHMARMDTVGYVEQSFMRFTLKPESELVDETGSAGCPEHNNYIAKTLLKVCLQFLVLQCEDRSPQLHTDVITEPALLWQLIGVLHCPSFTAQEAYGAVTLIAETLVRTVEHRFITTKPWMIEALMKALIYRRTLDPETLYSPAVELAVQLMMAVIILKYCTVISRGLFPKMIEFIESFVQGQVAYHIRETKDYLKMNPQLVNKTFITTLQLLYPCEEENIYKFSIEDLATMGYLNCLAKEVVFTTLELYVNKNPELAFESFKSSSTLQYFICLPYYLPENLKTRVHKLVEKACGDKVSVFPTLKGLALSHLASDYCGLDFLIGKSIQDVYSGIMLTRAIEKMRSTSK